MRIISSFHDYYDSVQQYGQDQSVIYLRKTIEYTRDGIKNLTDKNNKDGLSLAWDFSKSIFSSFKEYHDFYDYHREINSEKNNFSYSLKIFYFCGKAYPIIKLSYYDEFQPKNSYLYNENDINIFLIKNDIINYYANNKDDYHNKRIQQVINRLKNWINQIISVDFDWFVNYKIISIYCFEYYSNEDHLIINPRLDDIQFYKVMDSYTTYQELDMFISGTLSYPQNVMVEVSDEQKVLKHGFDPKYGFRKRKEILK